MCLNPISASFTILSFLTWWDVSQGAHWPIRIWVPPLPTKKRVAQCARGRSAMRYVEKKKSRNNFENFPWKNQIILFYMRQLDWCISPSHSINIGYDTDFVCVCFEAFWQTLGRFLTCAPIHVRCESFLQVIPRLDTIQNVLHVMEIWEFETLQCSISTLRARSWSDYFHSN